jgi:hypothetical protein
VARTPGGDGGGGSPAVNCAAFAIDNGCATRAIGIDTGRQPGFQDANTIATSARSGQLPPTTDSDYRKALAVRTAFFRKFNSYIPGVDGPIGSQDPTDSGSGHPGALKPISAFVDPTGTCKYWVSGSTGAPKNPFAVANGVQPNFVYCMLTHDNVTVKINDYDFSNEGAGTGTSFVPLYQKAVPGTFTNTTLSLNNVYAKCAGKWCPFVTPKIDQVRLIASQSAGGSQFVHIDITNVTFDGDNYNIMASPEHLNIPVLTGLISDNKNDDFPVTYTYHIRNTVIENTGHAVALSGPSGSWTFDSIYVKDTCVSGFKLCHGEVAELAQNKHKRHHLTQIFKNGFVWVQGQWNAAGPYEVYGEVTAPVYMTSGGPNGTIVDRGQVSDAFIFMNYQGCTNEPQAGNYPYGPDHACEPNRHTIGGLGIISLGWAPYIVSLDLERILADVTGNQNCYGVGMSGSALGRRFVVGFSGHTMTLVAPPAANPTAGMYPQGYGHMYAGEGIIDLTGSHGFTTTYIEPPGPNQHGNLDNFAKFAASLSGSTLKTVVSQNLEVGQPVYQDVSGRLGQAYGFVASGCPSSCVAVGTPVSGTTFQLVTTSGGSVLSSVAATSANVRSYNDTGNCIGGQNFYCGTWTLHDSEPEIAPTMTGDYAVFAHIDTFKATPDSYVGGTDGAGAGQLLTWADLASPSVSSVHGSCR